MKECKRSTKDFCSMCCYNFINRDFDDKISDCKSKCHKNLSLQIKLEKKDKLKIKRIPKLTKSEVKIM